MFEHVASDVRSIRAGDQGGLATFADPAEAKITVQRSAAKPFDLTDAPALIETRITETFIGDIGGEARVRALQLSRADHSAGMMSLQRVRRRLGDRQGTFVLQGSAIINNGDLFCCSWIGDRRSFRAAPRRQFSS